MNRRHAPIGRGIGRLEGDADVGSVLEKEGHIGQRVTEADVLDVRFGDLAGQIARKRERPLRRQVVRLGIERTNT